MSAVNKIEMKLTEIVIIGKFDDGKCRQLCIERETEDLILSLIYQQDGVIKVYDKTLETIDILEPQTAGDDAGGKG